MKALFPEFKPCTAAEWKNQLLKDLKGEPYENLVWHNENGFDIEPFYTAESLHHKYEPAFTHADWDICVHNKLRGSKTINNFFLANLESGASSISLNIEGIVLKEALKDVGLDFIRSAFFATKKDLGPLKTFLSGYSLEKIYSSIFPLDIKSIQDLDDFHKAAVVIESANISKVAVDVLSFHNQNCAAYYEIAVAFALLNEHLSLAPLKDSSAPIVIKTGVSSDYFIQIAKLRAIRRLWMILKDEYGIRNDLHIIAETSQTNKSVSDSYNNLLRTTVEAMAAVAGGCNELIVNDFDLFFPRDKKLASRMSVNQQLILKDESYLDKMADISCGSYYIEKITDQLAEKGLEQFKVLEQHGGFFVSLEKGIIAKDIQRQSVEKEKLFRENKTLLIGVNKYRNEKESLDISSAGVEEIRNLPLNNPGLDFELENFF